MLYLARVVDNRFATNYRSTNDNPITIPCPRYRDGRRHARAERVRSNVFDDRSDDPCVGVPRSDR